MSIGGIDGGGYGKESSRVGGDLGAAKGYKLPTFDIDALGSDADSIRQTLLDIKTKVGGDLSADADISADTDADIAKLRGDLDSILDTKPLTADQKKTLDKVAEKLDSPTSQDKLEALTILSKIFG